ncbi:hypothetical protein [Pontibacter rugosus]|uniref:Uncharacterized protein n=1 Tax=Pontibacter rugosus TaxID=1745966 RepID=A0ABW3SNI8_9BACT
MADTIASMAAAVAGMALPKIGTSCKLAPAGMAMGEEPQQVWPRLYRYVLQAG